MNTEYAPWLQRGKSCLLISVPHSGTKVPPALLSAFSASGRELPDTDWFVDRLYEWAPELGAGMIVAPLSRYVVDLNRPPDDAPLYDKAGGNLLTGLVPTFSFSGKAVYVAGAEPDVRQVSKRVAQYWQPYHQCLQAELERIRSVHGFAVLLDAHSIRSTAPLLFSGKLPDLNLGSNDGRSAHHSLIESATAVLRQHTYSMVVDGRFKGGYITRHYGVPRNGIHALQLEMAQSAYMDEETIQWRAENALPMQELLRNLVVALLQWQPRGVNG
jgi:N-formylglutamate amidohydrolase